MESRESNPVGTIIFSTVGRCDYGFDIFSLDTQTLSIELRMTDTTCINYNGYFIDDQPTLTFVSERTSTLHHPPHKLPFATSSLFHDRPIGKDGRVYFVSAPQPPASLYRSWPAVYSSSINVTNSEWNDVDVVVTRLTPEDVVDYSPALSQSGKYMAVASYGSKPWGGDIHELDTQIVVFPVSDPLKRMVMADRGGWPTWSGDDTIYFHRLSQEEDNAHWGIYRVDFPATEPPRRVTPPGFHVFTPAAFPNSKKIAVATRRGPYRHIEILDVDSSEFQPVTQIHNPETHHYNPFVSPGSNFLGYHRFRGTSHSSIIPNLESITSPVNSPGGDLVAYNPDLVEKKGGVKIMKSDRSKRWTLIEGDSLPQLVVPFG